MSDVENIADYRPHVTIAVGKEVHVIPVELIEDWIKGDAEPDPMVMRRIIQEWLRSL